MEYNKPMNEITKEDMIREFDFEYKREQSYFDYMYRSVQFSFVAIVAVFLLLPNYSHLTVITRCSFFKYCFLMCCQPVYMFSEPCIRLMRMLCLCAEIVLQNYIK